MTNSPDYHPATDFQASTNVVPGDTSKVHGWLLGMQEYESGLSVSPTKASETSAAIGSEPAPRRNRPLSISSISSEDSVNLEDLIKANYTSDMDDETALSDLAELDLDDSDEEFWKLDTSVRPIPQQSSSIEDRLQSLNLSSSPSPQQSNSGYPRSYSRHRSGSQSSENSFTSQSTITITSHHLRGNRASHIPLPPRPASQLSTQSTQRLQPTAGMLQQSRSSTDTSIARPSSRIASHTQSRLAKRASHIPTPSSMMRPPSAAPAPQHTLSTRSTTATKLSGAASRESSLLPSTRTPSRLANRASHIPATTVSRAKSPIPSRIAANGQRSSGIFSSGIFGSDHSRMHRSTTVHTPSPTKSTGAVRSSSRIGMARRAL